MTARCATVYLARKVDGMRYLPRFLASLQVNPAGHGFDLIVILKGYDDGDTPACLQGFRAPGLSKTLTMTFDDQRFATEAFFCVAEQFDHDAFLFFVSSARVLGPGWARIVFGALLEAPHRLVGTSSGLEPLAASTPFPNPSVRTTGFALRRQDWLSLERGDLSLRAGGNLFEAGPKSMTKQAMERGYEILIVGRDGRRFSQEAWPDSATFRLSRQENLLFADNRTDQFDLARSAKRHRLARMNWGSDIAVVPVSTARVYLRRLGSAILRKYWWILGSRIIRRR